jgi:hypothetical protein
MAAGTCLEAETASSESGDRDGTDDAVPVPHRADTEYPHGDSSKGRGRGNWRGTGPVLAATAATSKGLPFRGRGFQPH